MSPIRPARVIDRAARRFVKQALIALILVTAPARALPYVVRQDCQTLLLSTFRPGDWIVVADRANPEGRRPAQITEFGPGRIKAYFYQFDRVCDISRRPISHVDAAEKMIIERSLSSGKLSLMELRNRLRAAGAQAELISGRSDFVRLTRAPTAGTVTMDPNPELILNDPHLIDGLIARTAELGGCVVYSEAADAAGAAVCVDLRDIVRYASGEPPHWPLYLRIHPSTTRTMIAHELIHLNDIVIDPLPASDALKGLVEPERSKRDRRRNAAIKAVYFGILEDRAHRLGDRAFDIATGRIASGGTSQYASYNWTYQYDRTRAELRLSPTPVGLINYCQKMWILIKEGEEITGGIEQARNSIQSSTLPKTAAR